MSNDPAVQNQGPSPWKWFPEFWDFHRKRVRPLARLLGLSLIVGIAAGIGAIVFYAGCRVVSHYALDAIAGYRPGEPLGESPIFQETKSTFQPWLLLITATAGGLMSGLIVYTLAPEAEGHGTDAAIAAYHHRQGSIRPRVPVVKIVASAITLGTGGSGGREGPIALIGAGFGSYLGGVLRLRPSERRVLMAAGMGAGVAAIFRAPLAGALFAAEVLYRSPDFESDVIIPAGLASVSAYCTFAMAFGWQPLFLLPPEVLNALTFNDPRQLVPYLVLALLLVFLALIYTRTFYGLTHLFHVLPIKPHFKPAIGALASALVGVLLYFALGGNMEVLSVLSFGYGILQDVMTLKPAQEESLRLALVLFLVSIGKIFTTGLTIGSGGSGGVFGPSMIIGGAGGGAFGIVMHRLWPELVPHPATFMIVGMAGFFAAAAKTPFSTLVMVSEMTGNYNLLLPTLWVCVTAFMLSDEQSIYSSQVERRSLSPAHRGDYVKEMLAGVTVGQLLPIEPCKAVVRAGDSVQAIVACMQSSGGTCIAVVDGENCLIGLADVEEVQILSQSPNLGSLVIAADVMRTDFVPLIREESLDQALELLVEQDSDVLPVVRGPNDAHLVGMLTRASLLRVYVGRLHAAKPNTAVLAEQGKTALRAD